MGPVTHGDIVKELKTMISPEELEICVGEKAYEKFTGVKTEGLGGMHLYPNKYTSGVCVKHIPTGEMAYCNSENSQIKNRDKVIKQLTELIG